MEDPTAKSTPSIRRHHDSQSFRMLNVADMLNVKDRITWKSFPSWYLPIP